MMQSDYEVTELRSFNKKKTIVFLDGTAAFSLYNGELRRFGIRENGRLSASAYAGILEDVLWPRARERALNLITITSKTAQEIHNKLRQGYYPEEICKRVVDFLKEYGYVNDYEYARAYVSERIRSKSLRRLEMELRRKGIAEDIIKGAMEEIEPDEPGAIQRWLEKKAPNLTEMDYKEKRKVYSALLYRGYSYEQIQSVMDNFVKNG